MNISLSSDRLINLSSICLTLLNLRRALNIRDASIVQIIQSWIIQRQLREIYPLIINYLNV